jgi:hypothetical protein
LHSVVRWTHPVALGAAVAAAGAMTWALLLPGVSTDLSAQVARANFAAAHPSSAYDFSWYGGIAPAGYSLLAPYVLAAVGSRTAGCLAVVVSAGLLGALLARHQLPRPRVAALWGAVGLSAGLAAGQVTFMLGLAAALGSLALIDGHWPRAGVCRAAAGALALLTSSLSPVAGLFLGLAGAACIVVGRRVDGLVVGVGAALPMTVVGLFAVHGVQPISAINAVPSLLGVVFVLLWVPSRWRVIRVGAIGYGLGVVVTWAVPNPVGSNVERLGLLVVGPILVGTLAAGAVGARRLYPVVLAAILVWQLSSPIRDITNSEPLAAHTADVVALRQELRALGAGAARVEAVPQYTHWEAEELAGAFLLARGWERQIDTVRNPIFYHGPLSPADYHQWLRDNAVGYVVIAPAAKPDYAAIAEAAIVRAGQPWLTPVWHDQTWQIYRVSDSQPLASAPASVVSAGPSEITVEMPRAGTATVRVYWSSLLHVDNNAAVARAGDWTAVTVPRAGTYSISGKY